MPTSHHDDIQCDSSLLLVWEFIQFPTLFGFRVPIFKCHATEYLYVLICTFLPRFYTHPCWLRSWNSGLQRVKQAPVWAFVGFFSTAATTQQTIGLRRRVSLPPCILHGLGLFHTSGHCIFFHTGFCNQLEEEPTQPLQQVEHHAWASCSIRAHPDGSAADRGGRCQATSLHRP